MRLTFRRMADRRAVESLVERDDGVVFTLRGAGGGEDLPHDLVHALVESSLGIRDGVWGCVADRDCPLVAGRLGGITPGRRRSGRRRTRR